MSTNIVFDGDSSKYEAGDPLLNLSQEKRAYVEEVAYYAQQEYSRRVAAGEDWVLPEVAVSQAILETGWGQSRGANDFGIKAWSGSDRSKTTLATQEQSADGSYYGINASFEQTSSIEDSVNLYYDFITSNSRYSKALNLTDPYQSIREIKAVGYATSHSYADNLISIVKNYNLSRYSTTTITSFDYNENGYHDGVSAYEEAMKIIVNLETSIDNSENNIQTSCSAKPQIDYNSIIEFEKLHEVITTMKDLLERIKGIADREKYIAEQYNENDPTNSSLTQFQAAALSLGTVNYSFNSNEDFTKMVDEYKNSASNQVFSTWFQSYVSQNGVASNIIDMNEYTANIKATYAEASENHVISKASEVLSSENKQSTPTTTSSSTYSYSNSSSNNINYSANNFTSSSTTSKTQTTNSPQSSTSNNLPQSTQTSSSTMVSTTKTNQTTSSKTTQPSSPSTSKSSLPNGILQPGYISGNKNVATAVKDIASLISPGTTQPDVDPTFDTEIPTESTITEVIPGTSSKEQITTQQQKSNDTAVAVGIGIGAAALGVGAGAYYVNKKKKKNDNIAEEYEDEEEKTEYYQDDYYEDDQNFFPQDDLDNEDEYYE